MTQRVILHLMNDFWNASIGQIIKRLIYRLGSQDFCWHIGGLSGLGEMREEYEQAGAKTMVFEGQVDGRGSQVSQIRHYLEENHVEIIHTHTLRTLLAAWIAIKGSPFRECLPVKHIATKHTLTNPADRKWGLIYTMVDYLALLLPDVLVPVSQDMGYKIQSLPIVRLKPIVPISNAIPTSEWYVPGKRFEFRKQLGISNEAFLIGFGGRFEPVKRIDILLEAFAHLREVSPDVYLALAGEGSLRPMLEQKARQLQVAQSVTWVGFCKDMPGFLSALDVYVQTSVNEGLPLSLLEAMAAGKPVVATHVGGAAEVVTHGEDGILIPPRSAMLVFEAILDLLKNPGKRQQLGERARQSVQARYGLDRMIAGYRGLYEEIVP